MIKIFLIWFVYLTSFLYSKDFLWEKLNYPPINISGINAITFDDSNNIYVGEDYIRKSTDNGKTWLLSAQYTVTNLFFSKERILFGSAHSIGISVVISKDYGITWKHTGDSVPDDSTGKMQWFWVSNFIELANGMIVAGSSSSRQIHYTTDFGDTWFAHGCWDYSGTNGIAFNNFGELFAVSSKDYAIQKSIDTGKTWKYVRKPIDCTTCPDQYVPILFNPKSDYGIEGIHAAITNNQGKTWIDTSDVETVFLPPYCIDSMYNFITSGWIYHDSVKDYIRTIRRCKNDFSSYEDITDGIFNSRSDVPTCIETSPDGYIYVGMQDGRLFRSHQRYVSVKEPEPQQPAGIKISPNPACDFINISQPSEGLKPSEGSLIRIYNMLGEELKNLTQTSGDLTPGPSPKERGGRIDVSALPEGVYYVRVGNVNGAVFVVGR